METGERSASSETSDKFSEPISKRARPNKLTYTKIDHLFLLVIVFSNDYFLQIKLCLSEICFKFFSKMFFHCQFTNIN